MADPQADFTTKRYRTERSFGHPFGATWFIQAAWAHPLWNSYAGLLYDLTTPVKPEPVRYRPGMTHEFVLFALDPEHPWPNPDPAMRMKGEGLHYLEPPNMAYQFAAKDDDAAYARIDKLMTAIEERKMSPDTDFRTMMWDPLFKDGCSLFGRDLHRGPKSFRKILHEPT